MTSVYKQALKDWVATLDVKAEKVIDIGGSQDPIKGRTRSWEVKHYLIADLADPHVNNQSADILLNLDSDDVNILNIGKCDLLFCLEVFDYIRNPIQAFDNLACLLRKGGEAWVTFPAFYPLHNPVEAEGLRYTEPALRYYGDIFGIPMTDMIYRKAKSNKLLQYISEDGFRAAPNYDHSIIGFICRFKKL